MAMARVLLVGYDPETVDLFLRGRLDERREDTRGLTLGLKQMTDRGMGGRSLPRQPQ
jgi:hypothetical protein